MLAHLRQMAIFAKTIDHGSFRGAARELRLSPSVVSHHISELEDHLGVALLYRSTRKLRLTREGERLLIAARNMLQAVEGELLALSSSAVEPSGEIRLTAPSVLSQSDIVGAIAGFTSAHPRIKLSLDFSDQRRELIDDGFDIAIRMGLKTRTSAKTRVLFKVPRIIVATPAYLGRFATPEKPQELMDMTWLELSQVRNIPLSLQKDGKGKPVVLRPQAQVLSNDAQALYRLARAGAGLAVVPEFLATEDLASRRIVQALPGWSLTSIDVFAAWPANAPKDGLIRLFLKHLSESLAREN